LPLAPIVEQVLADVGHHAEAKVIAGMVEDQEPILAGGGAETATDCLDEQDTALGRLGIDDAPHIEVDAGGQHADIADDARLARPKPPEDGLTILPQCRAVHVFSDDADLDEALGDVLGMTTVDAEAKCRSFFAAPDPGLNDITVRTPARSGSDGAKTRKLER
jgi:hypothetical protein